MTEEPPHVSTPAREALMVWLKFILLLVVVGVLGWATLHLTQSAHGH